MTYATTRELVGLGSEVLDIPTLSAASHARRLTTTQGFLYGRKVWRILSC
jgi:hypothetical protein